MIIEEKGHSSVGTLDPQIAHILSVVDETTKNDKPLSETTPHDIRTGSDAIESFGIESEDVAEILELAVSGRSGNRIPIRVYKPQKAQTKPVFVFLHGGCWVFCDLNTHDNICRFLCNHADCVVVSVDYRLAPEHKFPAAVEDVYDVLKWLPDNAEKIDGDASKVAIGGDSAGGNIAASVALMARDRGEFDLKLHLLIYPITNINDFETKSYRTFPSGYFLSKEMMEWAGNHYISDDPERLNPYVSPLLAPDLSRLPPAFILTAEMDILRDEGEAYAHRLVEAGNEVRAIRYKGMVHAFVAMAGGVEMGKTALMDCAYELRRAFQ